MSQTRKQPVLIVEDNDADFEAIERAMKRSGLAQVVRATTGDNGLALLRSPDLRGCAVTVLLDLNIPGSDGREVLREIKSDPALRLAPVIIFTSSSNPRDVEGCYRDGANSYHLKPLPLHEFEATVEKIAAYWLSSVYVMSPGVQSCHRCKANPCRF